MRRLSSIGYDDIRNGAQFTVKLKPHPYRAKLLTRVKVLLGIPLRSWKGGNVSSVTLMGIFNLIVPIEKCLPLERLEGIQGIKNLAKRKYTIMFPLSSS